jgi:hypothetical protein
MDDAAMIKNKSDHTGSAILASLSIRLTTHITLITARRTNTVFNMIDVSIEYPPRLA